MPGPVKKRWRLGYFRLASDRRVERFRGQASWSRFWTLRRTRRPRRTWRAAPVR